MEAGTRCPGRWPRTGGRSTSGRRGALAFSHGRQGVLVSASVLRVTGWRTATRGVHDPGGRMSTTHHRTTGGARQLAHQRDLLQLLTNRDRLMETFRVAPVTDEQDAVRYLHLLAAVEKEIEEHLPDIHARELPHWLRLQAGIDPDKSVPRCPLCRQARQRSTDAHE